MSEYTPIMQQFLAIKEQHKDKVLLFRVGDFYELFFEDAVEMSKLLLLVLTSKGTYNGEPIPMAGFPARSSNSYITRLMRLNKKVAICEQVSDSKKNGLIDRKVVKILTPGTFFNDGYLREDRNNYIVCISLNNNIYGLAVLDVSTGYFSISRIDNKFDLCNEIDKLNPSEIIVSNSVGVASFLSKNFFLNKLEDIKFDYDRSYSLLNEFFGCENILYIDVYFYRSSIIAAGCLLDFVLYTQNNKLENIISLDVNGIDGFLYLDENSRKNLEIFKSLNGSEKNSIFNVIDRTVTAMGTRLLRRWLSSPILSRGILEDRFLGVSILKNNQTYLILKNLLLKICDLERILSKVVFSIVKPTDLKRLQNSLHTLPDIVTEIKKIECRGILEIILHNIHVFDEISDFIEKSIVDIPPASIKDGNFIRCGFDKKLDKYRSAAKDINSYLLEYQKSERIRLSIPGLFVNFLPKKGYFIEINKLEACKIGNDYRKISSTKKYFRYVSDELINIDREVSNAKIKSLEREKKIYKIILYKIKKNIVKMQTTAKYIAMLDVINSFAIQSSYCNWCEPYLVDNMIIDIKSGRHPVVEYRNNNVFIPNDLFLDSNKKGLIITGANMGGKSTYMRQAAIIILLAHIGSHVPAIFAKIGKVDKIFTRIGSSDDLVNSASTFMLEMKEMSEILSKSTFNSFILVDEIGRGTNYFEGKALAFSIIRELVEVNEAFFLFSTHFYDLHVMCDIYTKIGKIYFLVSNENDKLNFYYIFKEGYSDKSFGIDVAKTAGLPITVIDYAFLKLKEFKEKFLFDDHGLSCVNCLKQEKINNIISNLDPNSLSPKEALEIIYMLKDIFDDH